MCKHCLDMKKFGGTGNLRQACMLRKCENLTYAGADSAGGRGKIWELGGEGNKLSASACAVADLREADDLDEYKEALCRLTRDQLSLEVEWWKAHLESMTTNNPVSVYGSSFSSSSSSSSSSSPSYVSPFAGSRTFTDLPLSVRVDVVLAVCHFRDRCSFTQSATEPF